MIRIKLPENLKRKVRGQFVKNFLFRMLFNDKMSEQLEYNFKTVKQLTERPLSKVEDIIYLLETVQPRHQARKPVSSRRPSEIYGIAERRVLTLEGSEHDKNNTQLQAKGKDGDSLFFIESKETKNHEPKDDENGYPVIFQEYNWSGFKEKQGKKSNGVDFNFGPIEYPLFNEKCEDSWRVKSKSRQSSKSKERHHDNLDHNKSVSQDKIPSTKGNILNLRSVNSFKNDSESAQLHPSSAYDNRKAKYDSSVSHFKTDADNSSEKVSKRGNSQDKSDLGSAQKISFKNITAELPTEKGIPKPAVKEFQKSNDSPNGSESSTKQKDTLSPIKPPPTDRVPLAIDQMNIKEEVIQEIDEDDDSEDARRKQMDIDVDIPNDFDSVEDALEGLPVEKTKLDVSEPRASVINQLPVNKKEFKIDETDNVGANDEHVKVDQPFANTQELAKVSLDGEKNKENVSSTKLITEKNNQADEQKKVPTYIEQPKDSLNDKIDQSKPLIEDSVPQSKSKDKPSEPENKVSEANNKENDPQKLQKVLDTISNEAQVPSKPVPPPTESKPFANNEPSENINQKPEVEMKSDEAKKEAKELDTTDKISPETPIDTQAPGSAPGQLNSPPAQEQPTTKPDKTLPQPQTIQVNPEPIDPSVKSAPIRPPPPPPPKSFSPDMWENANANNHNDQQDEADGIVDNYGQTDVGENVNDVKPGEINGGPLDGGQMTQDLTVGLPGVILSSDEDIVFVPKDIIQEKTEENQVSEPKIDAKQTGFKEDEAKAVIGVNQGQIEIVKNRRPSIIKRMVTIKPVENEQTENPDEHL